MILSVLGVEIRPLLPKQARRSFWTPQMATKQQRAFYIRKISIYQRALDFLMPKSLRFSVLYCRNWFLQPIFDSCRVVFTEGP